MKPEQLDVLLYWVLVFGLVGIALGLLWLISAKLGRHSTRGPAMLAAVCALVYVGVGVAGAAIRAERPAPPAPAAEEAKAEPAPETKDAPPEPPPVDPAVVQAQQKLDAAVAGGDWEAAAAAHDALKALDAAHPALAPAWAKIEAGRAAAKPPEDATGGTGGDETAGETGDDGSTGAPAPAADEGGSTGGDETAGETGDAGEPEPAKKKKKKKARRPTPAGDGGAADGGAPPEPEPEPEPEPAPEG